MINEPKFNLVTEQYDVSFPEYYNMSKTFGHFCDDGRSYKVTDCKAPRPWFSIMCNENFASIRATDGKGLLAYKSFYMRLTKYYSETDYMLRTLNGDRKIILENCSTGKKYDLFGGCENMTFTVRPGSCEYSGSFDNFSYSALIFVPVSDPIECMRFSLKAPPKSKFRLYTYQDYAFINNRESIEEHEKAAKNITVADESDCVILQADHIVNFGTIYGFMAQKDIKPHCETYSDTLKSIAQTYTFYRAALEKEITVGENGECEEYIFTGADTNDCHELISKYINGGKNEFDSQYSALERKWDEIIYRNYCELPDKNMQYFLNIWLKNQVHVTSLYNRFSIMGYRDILQDSWGALYVDPALTREHMLLAASKMYNDGRCPRQFDKYSDMLDTRDFADSPVWLPITLSYYIRETNDFGILDEKTAYLGSDEVTTLSEHVLRSLNYMYTTRAGNGLVLMRGGDWLDGLGGLNKLGEATSVWLTIAAFYAQNLMAEIFDRTGEKEKAELMRSRSAEYKHAVNTAGWNGKWYSYAIINDTEVIGAPDNPEGKIFLNPQTWAIFTGIADEERTKKIMRAVDVYLTTQYGPELMAPPYVSTGQNYGRLQKQRPGTFANGAIYLHAGSFKVFADAARGALEEAYDTFMRLLPNHCDNPASRRTSEPYAVGNVHYGNDHQCSGLNLYSWFSATPSWLIHDGFEALLGVTPEFDGLRIRPLNVDGWNEYSLTRTFRGTKYIIHFKRSDKNRITADGKTIDGNLVMSDKKEVHVEVEFC